MSDITQKYNASKIAIQKINNALPILEKLRNENSPNYKTARQAFYDDIIPFVTVNNIMRYDSVLRAMDVFTEKLGILNGVKGWY